MKIGHKLKQARNNANLTQSDVANQMHVSRKTVSGWENDRSIPDIYKINELSALYDINLNDILDNQKRKENKRSKLNYALMAWYFNLVIMGLNLFNLFTGLLRFVFFLEIISIILFFSIYVYHSNNKITIKNTLPFSFIFLFVITALFFALQIEKISRMGFEIAAFTYVGALFRAIVLDYGVLIIFTFKKLK
ncbi:helix-turn-helix domain-containing protein [Nicoliella spurrieriana]|uniref:Helix-turn-helix domain-containing protein n=1 Tax=Nicoliella spurrieriana TaxID=2925830 RepID=A0A976RSC6_9LACO|nr:helix-turn-helix transcriptional regulator [Nicoliella spurrieriana]UQS86973.1 helix-turn-helix domain-containing protein [Nicoliella spurrieriana]